MTAVIPLGTFNRVQLREAWPTEHENFTPWLAAEANIAQLGQALSMELEVEAIEHWVGPFRADILARRVDDEGDQDHRVIIENQFGRTDHVHLGQILTYLAGIENAKTVVWLAETIQADHRAAVDWLNANTTEEYSFFAIEIELWTIGNSAPAPRFNVVASPNDWTRQTRRATGGSPPTESHQFRMAYWASFAEYLRSNNSTFEITRVVKSSGYRFASGRSHVVYAAQVSVQRQRLRVGLLILRDADKLAFRALLANKDAIETQMGESLDWQGEQGHIHSRISVYRSVSTADEGTWREQHAWMLSKLDAFRATFGPRISTLQLSSAASLDAENDGDE